MAADQMLDLLRSRRMPEWVITAWEVYNRELRAIALEKGSRALLTRSEVAQIAGVSVRRLMVACEGQPVSFIDDLRELTNALKDRERRLVRARWGLDGRKRPTLEELGAKEGITRERARQIVAGLEKKASTFRPPCILIALTEAAGLTCGSIITANEWYGALPVALRPPQISDMRLMDVPIRLGWVPLLRRDRLRRVWIRPSEVETASGISDGLQEKMVEVRRILGRDLRRWGAVRTARLMESEPEDGRGLAYTHLSTDGEPQTIDGWLVPSGSQSSLLVQRVRRIAWVTSHVEMGRLQKLITRSLGTCPPPSVLRVVLKRDLGAEPDEQDIVDLAPVRADSTTSPLAQAEILAVELLKKSDGVTVRALQRHFARCGYSVAMAMFTASRSSVLERPTHGVITLAGRVLTRETLARLKAQVTEDSAAAYLGYRNLAGGKLACTYKVDPDLLSIMSFTVPHNRVPCGEWRVQIDNESFDQVLAVRRGYVSGVHKLVKPLMGVGARTITLTFDGKTRTIKISG